MNPVDWIAHKLNTRYLNIMFWPQRICFFVQFIVCPKTLEEINYIHSVNP